MTDQRYGELLRNASGFFARAEEHSEEARQAMIADIVALMKEHGLTLKDLC